MSPLLANGTRLGPYEVLAPIGAGGMGEVYRARDTRLDRTVAIKVLPPAFASNSQLKQRFEREARLISQLSHPNICTIHDFGQDSGVDYLVLEYLEGESLAERLAKGPLPVEKALRVAMEIADALEKAHKHGIVHRDLKPGNVMLTKTGAKLLDFGLAKTAAPAVDGDAPTMQKSLTAEGTIVGTFQYMAPEQLEGQNADARTDLFAFGALLYEMLTGKRAFEGKTRTSVIAAIVDRDPPPISQFQPLTPPSLVRLVRNCLAKDPDERWQTAHDVMLELRAIEEGDSTAGIPRRTSERRRRREWLAWSLAALFFAAAAIATIFHFSATPQPAETLRTSIVAPAGAMFDFAGDRAAALTISPDGRFVTFVGPAPDGISRLWIRRLDQLEAQPLAGTDHATYPFWSPDSSQIGFFSERKMKRVAPTGGAVVTITADVRDSRGAAWGPDGTIVYSHHWRSPLFRINAAGGKATPITKLDEARRETTHRYPHFLPDGKHFLYLVGSHIVETTSGENAIYVASLDGDKPPRLIMHARSNAVYAMGSLLFYLDGRLMAQPFDLDELAVHGQPVPLAERVRYERGFFRAVFSASAGGTLVYQHGGTQTNSELIWFDRSGKRLGTLGEPAEYFDVHLSRDGKQVISAIDDPSDLWLFDLVRGSRTRVTLGAFGEQSPVFSPDGTSVAYASDRTTLYDMFRKSLTGSAEVQLLGARAINEYPTDWTDRFIVYEHEDMGSKTQSDIWGLPLSGGAAIPLVQTAGVDLGGRVSPDGRWMAYSSNETGRAEVYVTSFPESRGKWQISQHGGLAPAWREDGRELFFISGSKVMAATVAAGETFDSRIPVELFSAHMKSLPPPFYDVSPDGNKFLVNVLPESATDPITVVTNWPAALQKK